MEITYVLIGVCAVIGGWSFLAVLGNERQRGLLDRPRDPESAGTPATPPDNRQLPR
jgi:hypothetical protein